MANVVVTYAIVFSGEIVEGFQIISVKAHMAKLLKADAEKMKALFSGKPVVIKRTTNKAEAAKYGTALKKIGADVRVKVIKKAAPETPPPNSEGGLSLAPQEGFITQPKAAPKAPEVDISGLSLAENDGTPLTEPEPEPEVDVDTSDLSLSDNDGSPLVEPAPEVPKRDAPDFGLDAPGAELETLKEEVKEVHPDISGMSLAFPGGDLLNDDEKEKGPPPVRPDISQITLTDE